MSKLVLTSEVLNAELLHELELLLDEVQERPQYPFEKELQELKEIIIDLQEVPEESVADFNTLYSWMNAHRDRVSNILIDINRERAVWKEYRYRVAQLYRKGRTDILTSNADIIKLRNKELQEVAVQQKLPEVVDLQELIRFYIDTLDDIEAAVELKRDAINSANMDLSRQQRVVEILQGINYPISGKRTLTIRGRGAT